MEGMIACPGCHRWVPEDSKRCPQCGALLPQAAKGNLTREQQAQREAYERYKLEMTHVPPWLRKVVGFFTYCYNNPLAHRIVQWSNGVLFFVLAFGATEALRSFMPNFAYLKGDAFIIVQVALACLAFYLASQFVFMIFKKNVETMLMIWGDEQDVRIMQGQLQQQYDEYRKSR